MGYHTSIKSSKKKRCIDRKPENKIKCLQMGGSEVSSQFDLYHIFENHNSSISVNVFGYEKLVYPFRISNHNYKRDMLSIFY